MFELANTIELFCIGTRVRDITLIIYFYVYIANLQEDGAENSEKPRDSFLGTFQLGTIKIK